MQTSGLDITNQDIRATLSTPEKPAWGAVFSMGLGVAGLIMAELLPISLLTPMANELGISEGAAGQTVTATAIIALMSSLFCAVLTRRIDRKIVVVSFSGLLIVSCLLVGLAQNFATLLIGRLLLGVAVGGFWSMAASIAMRLVPQDYLAKAFSIIFGSVSISTAVSAPLGTYLGSLIGWRGTFMAAAAIGLIALIWQYAVMPAIAPRGQSKLQTLWAVLKRPQIGLGMLAVLLVFGGHQTFLTYLRPVLETVTQVGVNRISTILLLFGVASFIGTSLAGPLLKGHLRSFLLAAPILMALLAGGLLLWGSYLLPTSALVTVWGLIFGTVPVAWSTWTSQAVPDEAESAGGLLVACIQLGMGTGAAAGGILFDASGSSGLFIGTAVTLIVAAIIIKTAISSMT